MTDREKIQSNLGTWSTKEGMVGVAMLFPLSTIHEHIPSTISHFIAIKTKRT